MDKFYVYFGDIKNEKQRKKISKLLQKAALDAGVLWIEGGHGLYHVDSACGYSCKDDMLQCTLIYSFNFYKKEGTYGEKLSITKWLNKMEEIKEGKK